MSISPAEPGVFRQSFELPYPDADAAGYVRLTAILDLLQVLAGEHTASRGFDYRQHKEQGIFWVLSRMSVRFDHRVPWPCRMAVDTWARSTKAVFALRDFRFGPEGGPWAGRASSAWVLLKDRKPQRPEPWVAIYDQTRPEDPTAEMPAALPPFPDPAGVESRAESLVSHCREIRADWEDLDMNGHVNNVSAVGWCLAQHDFDFLMGWSPEFLEANFLAEMFCGQKFQVLTDEVPGAEGLRTFDSLVLREEDQVPTLRLRISFRKG